MISFTDFQSVASEEPVAIAAVMARKERREFMRVRAAPYAVPTDCLLDKCILSGRNALQQSLCQPDQYTPTLRARRWMT